MDSYRPTDSLAPRIQGVEKALAYGGILALFLLQSPPLRADFADTADHQEARKFLKERKWSEAAIILRTLHKRRPGDLPLVVDLVKALTNSSRREEALSVLSEAESRETKGAHHEAITKRIQVVSRLFISNADFQTYQEGLNLLQAQKYRAARERFEKALEKEPDNVEILLRQGQCLLLDGDADSAAERLRLARKLNPVEPEVRLWLGRALQLRGELRDALTELKLARKELVRSERSAIWYADLLVTLGDKRAAIDLLEQDLAQNPGHVGVLLALARTRVEDFASREAGAYWAARKDAQLASSRIGPYLSPDAARFEGDLGVEIRIFSDLLKEELQSLQEKIDRKIESMGGAAQT